jgi:rod shape determining protein RodA
MVTGVMPVTGVPLPFITYGGSSLIALLFGLGILQSIRMRSHKPDL